MWVYYRLYIKERDTCFHIWKWSCGISKSFKFSVEFYIMGGKRWLIYISMEDNIAWKKDSLLYVGGAPSAIIAIPSRGQRMRLWKWQPCHHYLIIPIILLMIIRRDRWRTVLWVWDAEGQPSSDGGLPISQSFSAPLERVTGQTGWADCQAASPSWLADECSLHAARWPGCLTHSPCQPQTQLPAQRASGA